MDNVSYRTHPGSRTFGRLAQHVLLPCARPIAGMLRATLVPDRSVACWGADQPLESWAEHQNTHGQRRQTSCHWCNHNQSCLDRRSLSFELPR